MKLKSLSRWQQDGVGRQAVDPKDDRGVTGRHAGWHLEERDVEAREAGNDGCSGDGRRLAADGQRDARRDDIRVLRNFSRG